MSEHDPEKNISKKGTLTVSMIDTEFAQKPNRRALRRKLNLSKARRKAFLSRNIYGIDWYRHMHQYSKNKIHCSCNLCCFQSFFEPDQKPLQDKKRIEDMDEQIKELP